MAIIDRLPNVNKCCFCISLKIGTIIIAILGIISVASGANANFGAYCNEDSTIQKVLKYLAYVVQAMSIAHCITSIILLYAVFAKKPKYMQYFIYTVFLIILLDLVVCVITLVVGITNKNCEPSVVNLIRAIISCLMGLYFSFVVNSFRSQIIRNVNPVAVSNQQARPLEVPV